MNKRQLISMFWTFENPRNGHFSTGMAADCWRLGMYPQAVAALLHDLVTWLALIAANAIVFPFFLLAELSLELLSRDRLNRLMDEPEDGGNAT